MECPSGFVYIFLQDVWGDVYDIASQYAHDVG